MEKLVKEDEINALIKKLRSENKTIVFTNGCFDILHAGHVRYLKESKSKGDVLIVGLNSDSSIKKIKGESRPINNEQDRTEVLSALENVNYIIVFNETTPVKLLDKIKPAIYTKCVDYTIQTLPEADTVIKNGGRVKYIKLVEDKSTT